MFVLPSNFNVITDISKIRSGVNILVPHTGVPRRLQEYLENVAVTRASERNIVGVLIELTTNKFPQNDITSAQAYALPRRSDYSYCMYKRVQTLVFKSYVLEQNFIYRDYTFILNVVKAEVSGIAHMPWFYDKLCDWMRYYELRFETYQESIKFYRNDTLFFEVYRADFLELLVESSSRLAYGSVISGITHRLPLVQNLPKHGAAL